MHEYDRPCTYEEYVMAKRGREESDRILHRIMTADDPESKADKVEKYNRWCTWYNNDRADYTLGELEDMYYGPFSIRPECFAIETMFIQEFGY